MNNDESFAIVVIAVGMFFLGAVAGCTGTENKFTKALCNNDPIEVSCTTSKRVSPAE